MIITGYFFIIPTRIIIFAEKVVDRKQNIYILYIYLQALYILSQNW